MCHVEESCDGPAVVHLPQEDHDGGVERHEVQQVPSQVKVQCLGGGERGVGQVNPDGVGMAVSDRTGAFNECV